MPQSVDAAFNQLARDIAGSTSERDATVKHRDEIKKRLELEFETVYSLSPIGSFGNGTNVRGFSDADYLAWLPRANGPARSDSLLVRVRETLEARFPKTPIVVRTPAVCVAFAGGDEQIEVVPAYWNGETDGQFVFEIAAGGGDWQNTAPSLHNQYVHQTHLSLESRLKPLIRMVKYWRYVHGLRAASFYLEMRTTSICSTRAPIVYKIDFPFVLKQLHAIEFRSMVDPTGISHPIPACPESYRAACIAKADWSVRMAALAAADEAAERIPDAFSKWNLVFNGGFPSYG
jgi:hypothetical protein